MNNSGYIAININGNQVGLKFGMLAIRQIGEYSVKVPFYDKFIDKDGEEKDTYSLLGLAHIIYGGYANNQYIKMQDVVMPFEEVFEWLEDETMAHTITETVNAVLDCYNNSKYMKPLVEKEETTKKKSGPGKK